MGLLSISLVRVVAALCLGGLSASALAVDYYVDSSHGRDSHPGTRDRPWKSIARVNAAPLQAGDKVLLARGTSYVGVLKIGASGSADAPILVSAYGKGSAPRLMNPRFGVEFGRTISVLGSHVIIDGLYLHDSPAPPPDKTPVPWPESEQHKLVTEMAAVFVDKAAHHVTVRNCEFSNALVGVRVRGSRSLVTRNYLHDAAKITEQWGAMAIVIVGPYNEVS